MISLPLTQLSVLNDILKEINDWQYNHLFDQKITWRHLYLQEMKYFTSQFKFKTEDKELMKIEPHFFRVLWNYGGCLLLKGQQGYKVAIGYDLKFTPDGDLISGKAIPIPDLALYVNTKLDEYDKPINVTKDTAVWCTYGQGLPAVIEWKPYLMEMANYYDRINTSAKLLNKKLNFSTAYSDAGTDQIADSVIQSIINEKPYIISYKGSVTREAAQSAGRNTAVQPINDSVTEINLTTSSVELMELANWFKTNVYKMFGKREEVNQKAERNVVLEVETSVNVYDVLDNYIIRNYEVFCERVKNAFSVDLEIISVGDYKSDERMKRQQEIIGNNQQNGIQDNTNKPTNNGGGQGMNKSK